MPVLIDRLKTAHLSVFFALFITAFAFSQASAQEPIEVSVIQPEASRFQHKLNITGSIEAVQNAQLAVLEAGVIQTLWVEVGDRVEKGQLLLQLDDTLAKLSLAEIEADLNAAQLNMQEAVRLHKEVIALSEKRLVAQTLIAERKTALAIAKANRSRVQAELKRQEEIVKRHQLRAPFAGLITARNVDIGEWATEQTPVLTLLETSKLRARLEIPQEHLQDIVRPEKVTVQLTPDTTASQAIHATIDRVISTANENSRTFTVLINLPQDQGLINGMSVSANVHLANHDKEVVWLPTSAIKQHPDGGMSIFSVVNNQTQRHLISVVERDFDRSAVIGAPLDQPIIASGVELLREEMVVIIKGSKNSPQQTKSKP